ncbi:MAG: hypothetical protein ACRDKJ_01060 [Actinomycetota bacterium]
MPIAADPLLETARQVGVILDVLGIQDHPYQRRYVDTWTLMAMWSGERDCGSTGSTTGCTEPTRDLCRLIGSVSGSGAYGPKAIALTGRSADGWVPSFQ